MPHTNISKLIYAAPTPKNTPTKAKVKSIHRYSNKTAQKTNNEYLKKKIGDSNRTTMSEEFQKNPLKPKTVPKLNYKVDQINSNEYMKQKNILDLKQILNKKSYINDFKKDTLKKKERTPSSIHTSQDSFDEYMKNNQKLGSLRSSSSSLNLKINKNINIKSNLKCKQGNTKQEIVKADCTILKNEHLMEFKRQSERENRIVHENIYVQKKKANKEEIKKRLQELHKSSLKILKKNLKKATKKAENPTITQMDQNFSKSYPVQNQTNFKDKINNSSMILDKFSATSDKSEINNKVGLLRNSISDEHTITDIKDYNNKGIEILKSSISKINLITEKRPEAINYVSQKNFDPTMEEKFEIKSQYCENQNERKNETNSKSDNQVYKLNDNIGDKKEIENQMTLKIPNNKLETKGLKNKSEKAIQVEIAHNNNKENIPTNYDSDEFIKSVQIEPTLSHRQNSQCSKNSNNCKNIPYWLQETSVEIYPYNFITAVRKKLEVLTNPILKHTEEFQHKKILNYKNLDTTYQETPLSRSKLENENVRRRIIDNNQLHKSNSNQTNSQILARNEFNLANNMNISNILVDNKNVPSYSISEQIGNSHSFPEISNFSSISLHLPEVNTISDISSVKNEAQILKVQQKGYPSIINSENSRSDDTTISSSVFYSPEHKKCFNSNKPPKPYNIENISESIDQTPRPLSLGNIVNLQIKLRNENSKSNIIDNLSQKSVSEYNFQTDIKPNNDEKKMIKSDQNIAQLDQLLEDFNKNLSQVINVNNQLKSTLDKSQQIFSPRAKKKQSNYKYNDTSIIPKLSSSSFITAVEYTSDFEDYVSNTMIESVNSLNKKDYFNSDKNNPTSSIFLDTSSKSDIAAVVPKSTTAIIFKEATENSIKEKIQNGITCLQDHTNEVALLNSRIKNINFAHKAYKDDFIENHVNTIRGNDNIAITQPNSTSLVYVTDEKTGREQQYLELSVGSEFLANYNKSDIELSMFLQDENKSVSSGVIQNYSSIGVYEQLLQSENLKTENLTALLKIREKMLVDRTKGQVAWLEVQKEKYKNKGLSEQITAIKKKQRAILIKMEKEREEIKKLINRQLHNTICDSVKIKNQNQKSLFKTLSPKLSESLSNITIRKGSKLSITNKIESSTKSVRAYDIGSSQNLIKLLEKREEELRNRRKHVERLMEWHKRLDKEEEEVNQIEQNLLKCNKNIRLIQPRESFSNQITTAEPNVSQESLKKGQKLIEIEKSLEKLQSVSGYSKKNSNAEYVRISGHKLNKLWTRLTGQNMNKFDSYKKYKFTKTNLEKFYERAKEKVIEEFDKPKRLENFVDQSLEKNFSLTESNNETNYIEQTFAYSLDIPSLYLNFSSDSDINDTLESRILQQSKDQNYDKLVSVISDCEKKATKNIRKVPEITNNISATDLYEIKSFYEQENQNYNVSLNTPSRISKDLKKNVKDSNFLSEAQIITDYQQETLYGKSDSTENCSEIEIQEHIILQTNDTTKEEIDNTLILKEISFGPRNFIQESLETNMVSNKISENRSFPNTINTELVRPSVIVSPNLYQNEILKQKKEFNPVTSVELNTNHETITTLIKSAGECSANTITSDQTAKSVSNSTNPLSSALLEKLQNDQSSFITSSASSELKYMLSSSENTFEKNFEYSYEYDNDFSESDLTNLENISMPIFETTMELTKRNESVVDINTNTNLESCCINKDLENSENATELEKRLIVIDESLKDLNETIENILSPENKNVATNSTNDITINSANSTISLEKEMPSFVMNQPTIPTNLLEQHADSYSSIISNNTKDFDKIILMPDIINEVEIRRRQQILIESEIQQFENALPYVVFREIPNKPPPPYVPPAHGSPMTTIFPPESRIKEITFRRTAELFQQLTETNENLQQSNAKNSILTEQITNIYERIILDICRECMQEYEDIFHDLNPECYKNSLALYNPPDKLNCIQEFIYCRVRKLLAIEKSGHRKSSIFFIGKKKRDHVDEILLQELLEDDYKWTNFDAEEHEVKISIVEDILNDVIKGVVIDVLNKNKNTLNT